MTALRSRIYLILGFVIAMFIALSPVAVSAQFNQLEEACSGTPGNEGSQLCEEIDNAEDPVTGSDGVILKVADILGIVAGIIAVIIIIVAGITMMLSSGDSGKVQSSRNAIIYTVVGIAVIVLARSLVIFIINQTG